MLCHRCRGCMVEDQWMDARICELVTDAGWSGAATRCINCGDIEDPVIRANRIRLPVARRPAASG